jgi:mono/diheme cytochrome c family protein
LLATGGGLLFVGRSDGRLTALDSTSGKQLWEFQTGAGMHAPVSTFEHTGKQYVIAFSAGNALIGSARGDSVWLFGLDGTLPPAQPGIPVPRSTAIPAVEATRAAEAAAAGNGPSPSVAAANLAEGKRLFEQACVVCHGTDGKGGHGGGAPLDRLTDLTAAIQTVTAGRNDMPPFRATFTADQIRDVSAYAVEVLAQRAVR